MSRLPLLPTVVVALAFSGFESPASAVACGSATVLASQPAGAFLENLLVEQDGTVLFTSYMDKTLRRYRPGRGADTLATLPAHPVSVARRGRELWIVSHGTSFADGPGFMQTNRLLRVDSDGAVLETIDAPDARFLNGMADLPDGDLLIADSVLGVVWRFSVEKRAFEIWLSDPLLLPAPSRAFFLPGANGIELVGKRLLISNTSRGTLLTGSTDDEGRPGALSVLANGPIDDFYVEPAGDVIAATHQSSVFRITPAGAVSPILSSGADGSTAVAAIPGKTAAYVVTTGAAPGGPPGSARLLEVALPGGARLCPR